jgi:hypothetical protein
MRDVAHLTPKTRLELKNHALSKRMATLFEELAVSEGLQKAFIQSPAEVIGLEVLGREYTPQQAAAVNQFLFSVLANKKLQKWGEEYSKEHPTNSRSVEERAKDLSAALLEFGDRQLMSGLLEAVASGAELPGLGPEAASLIVKADSVAIGNWFVYKVSGDVFSPDNIVLPPELVQVLAAQLVERASQLQQDA